VDEGAAVDSFLSDGQELAARATSAFRYMLGLTDEVPAPGTFGQLAPERVREFTAQFLAAHGLVVAQAPSPVKSPAEAAGPREAKKEKVQMGALKDAGNAVLGLLTGPETNTPTSAPPMPEAKVTLMADLNAMIAAFPDQRDFALEAFKDGLTIEAAKARFLDSQVPAMLKAKDDLIAQQDKDAETLAQQIKDLKAENEAFRTKVLKGGPADIPHADATTILSKEDAIKAAKLRAQEKGVSFEVAYKEIIGSVPPPPQAPKE